jgi:hypothetical protein
MTHLLARAPKEIHMRPLHSEQIEFVYDVKEAWHDFIEDIHYHQVPHCFRFSFLYSIQKAVMQYKLFSSEAFYWLPVPADEDVFLSGPLSQLSVPSNPLVGGWSTFMNSLTPRERDVCSRLGPVIAEAESDALRTFMSDVPEEADDISAADNSPRPEKRGVICLLKVSTLWIISYSF